MLAIGLVACPKPPAPEPQRPGQVEVEVVPTVEELLRRGHAALQRGEVAAAHKAIKQVLVTHPDHLEAHVLRAMVAEATGAAKETTEAWRDVERILVYCGKLGPFVLRPALYTAARHYVKAERPNRARLFLDELWRRFPESDWSVKAQMMVAESELAKERWVRVIEACEVLARLRPNDPQTKRCRDLSLAAERMLQVGPEPGRDAQRWVWEHPLPQGNQLNDAWAAPSREIFAVGEAGTIVHRDAKGQISVMASGTRWSLKGIGGSSRDSIYTVGAAGIVLHFDGSRWTVVRPPQPSEPDLWAVSTSGPGNAVAVGDQGVVLRLANGAWTRSRPVAVALRGVWGDGKRYYAVGAGGTMLTFNGGRWKVIASDSYEDLWSVWGASADDVFAVGDRKTTVRVSQGRAKEQVVGRGGFRDVWGFGGQVWAVGTRGEVVRFDGRSWRNEATGCLVGLFGVAGASPAELWAVGEGGTLLRRRGNRWARVAGGLQQDLVAVVPGPLAGEGHALGRQGVVLRRDRRGRWRQVDTLPLLGTYRDLWSDGKRWIAVGERGVMVVRSGVGKPWRRIATDTPEDLLSVWGYEGGAVAVGTRGTVVRLVGENVVRDQTPTGLDLRDVWGTARSLVAVGNRGMVLRFDGERWNELETGVLNDLHAVWGLSPDKVVAVGSGGTILGVNGRQVTQQVSPVYQTLVGVWGSSMETVFAVSQWGAIIKYDGTGWQVQVSPAACLTAIAGDPATGVLAVGCHGTVVRWQP
jgi:hypothetical protein